MKKTIALITALILILPGCIVKEDIPMVYMVYSGSKGDRSYSDTIYEGLFMAQEDFKFNKKEFNRNQIEEVNKMLMSQKFVDDIKPGLIIVVGYNYDIYSKNWTSANPDVKFVFIDQRNDDIVNGKSIEITSYGSSYLAGVLAAQQTKNNKIGIILGTKSWVLDNFENGFLDGAAEIDPSISITVKYVSDGLDGFFSPKKAQEIAEQIYEKKADIIYAVAGRSNDGIIEAAKQGKNRFVIGVDTDQTYLGPYVIIASALKNLNVVVYDVISEFLDGEFKAGNFRLGVDEGITGLVFNPRFIEYKADALKFTEKAIDGEKKVDG